jgi:hypothetical protein
MHDIRRPLSRVIHISVNGKREPLTHSTVCREWCHVRSKLLIWVQLNKKTQKQKTKNNETVVSPVPFSVSRTAASVKKMARISYWDLESLTKWNIKETLYKKCLVMFCRSLFVLLYFCILGIVLSVLRLTISDYPFDIFKLFSITSIPLDDR